MPTSSSSIQQQQQQKHQHDVVMGGSLTPPPLPSTSTQPNQHSPGGASTTTSTPSSTSSAKGAGSSRSATTATTGTTTTGTAGTTTTATRNKRQELSFAERIQVIQARTSGKSMRQLALQFGCGKTQILNILGQRDAYLKEWEDKQAESNPHISARKRRSRRTGNEETNQKVWDWYNRQKNMGVRVTGPMLQREARSIARNLNIPNFAASNGWLDSFRRLHNIVSVVFFFFIFYF
jgi:transposase-like protein